MSIKVRALLIAAAIGVVIQIILDVIANATGLLPALSGARSSQDVATLSMVTSVVGVISCICFILLDVCVGGLYAYLHSRQGGLTLGGGALGGAIASLLARLVSGLFNTCVSVLLMPFIIQQMGSRMSSGAVSAAMGVALASAIGMLCVWMLIGGILGAIGGVITAAILGRNQKPAAPAA